MKLEKYEPELKQIISRLSEIADEVDKKRTFRNDFAIAIDGARHALILATYRIPKEKK